MPFRTEADKPHGASGGYRTEADRPADTGATDIAKSAGSGLLEGTGELARQAAQGAAAGTFGPLGGMLEKVGDGKIMGAVRGTVPFLAKQAAQKLGGSDKVQTWAQQAASLLTGGDMGDAAKAVGAHHDPQTKAGQYAERIAAAAPGAALMPGSLLTRAAGTVLPAAATQGAGDATRALDGGAKTQQAAELAAALIAGGAAGGVRRPGTADRMLTEATKGATDAQIRMATELMKKGQALPAGGVRVTGDEALAQVTEGGSGIQKLSRAVTNTRKGGARVAEALQTRPTEVRNAAMGTFDQIAPPIASPAKVGLRGQEAAEDAIKAVKRERSAQVEPDYAAAGPERVDSLGMRRLLIELDDAIAADKTGLVGGRLKQMRDLLAKSPDVENIDRVRKFFRDRSELPVGSTDALTGEESKAIGGFLQHLSNDQGSGLLDAVPEFAAGKQKYQDLSRTLVEPVTSGPVGRIATEATDLRADPVQQGSRLYPSNPPEGAVNETVAALRNMNGQDPAIGADLTRLHLTNRFNETTQDLMGGQNMAGGAKFAADIAGNRAQEGNLMGGIGEVAPGAAPGMQDLIEVLRATGRRGNEGSPTASYQQFGKDLGIGEAPVELAKSVARPLGIPARIGGWLEDRALEQNSDKLLDVLLADPEKFQSLLLKSRATGGGQPMAQELARALTGYGTSREVGQ